MGNTFIYLLWLVAGGLLSASLVAPEAVQCPAPAPDQAYGDGRYRLKWVESLNDGLEQLAKGGVDIVLIDLGLPDSSGPSSLASVRKTAPEVPVLVLTGDTCEETEFAAAAYGMDDYLIKDQVAGAQLVHAIHSSIRARKLQKRQKDIDDQLIQRLHW